MGAKLFINTQEAIKGRSKNLICLGYVKILVTMATHIGFEDGGVPTKLYLMDYLS